MSNPSPVIPRNAAIDFQRIAFIGNALPRRCGIATFTSDLQQAIAASPRVGETRIVAMTDPGQSYDYPPVVAHEIRDDRADDYQRAAAALNAGDYDLVSLQHEFGIFGGEAGDKLLPLLSRLTAPVVTTLHTVLAAPTPKQRLVMGQIIEASAKIVVMAEKARSLLREVYGAPADKIEVIAHGVPDFPFVEPDDAKAALGFSDRSVILTFGLLSPNKGVEVMIDAMPAILKRRADAVYVVLGATHPTLKRRDGEAYRESLVRRARDLGVEDQVVFLDQFVDQATLLGFIAMSDVYVTPYLTEAQMTSGTLSYSFGLGKAVVSTPYWHARELLAEGRGVLVPFGDSLTIGEAVAGLLTDTPRRNAMRQRAYAASRPTTWARTAERYLTAFDAARRAPRRIRPAPPAPRLAIPRRVGAPLPALQFGHLLALCDDTGMAQHAVHGVADRAHGYCVDDNARGLLLTCALNAPGEHRPPPGLTARFAAFVQHAWNPDTRRFRNFMSYDRRWLEPQGSEDSHGRTLWALGVCARDGADAPLRRWAMDLFADALGAVEAFTSPRAWAFTLIGLDAYCAAQPNDLEAKAARQRLAQRLMANYADHATPDWSWFEPGLAYDNARLPEALILTGAATSAPEQLAVGLKSLAWLMGIQTAPGGHFRPVGSDSFGDLRFAPRPFDQQPLEAAATIAACSAAWRIDGASRWRTDTARAFAWFLGDNDLATPLVDLDTGACRDGLHPDRANENRGGESVVSYLLGLAEMRRLARIEDAQTPSAALLSAHA